MVDMILLVLLLSLFDMVFLCLNDMFSVMVGDYDYFFVWENENGDMVVINEGFVFVGVEVGIVLFIFEVINGCGVVVDILV